MSVKHVISLSASLALVLLVYASFSVSNVLAVPPDSGFSSSANCGTNTPNPGQTRCCWREKVSGQILGVRYCQTCTGSQGEAKSCEPKQQVFEVPPTSGPFVLPEEGVLQQPSPPPTSPFGPLGSGGVLQQPTTATPPPLFGRNTAAPLGGGVLGQPTTIAPTTPTTPISTPPPQFGQIAPQVQVNPVPPECPKTPPYPPDCTKTPTWPVTGGILQQPKLTPSPTSPFTLPNEGFTEEPETSSTPAPEDNSLRTPKGQDAPLSGDLQEPEEGQQHDGQEEPSNDGGASEGGTE